MKALKRKEICMNKCNFCVCILVEETKLVGGIILT